MPRIGLDSPLSSSKRAIGVGQNGKACSSLPAFNYIQSTAPLLALIGETWRKVDSDRIIAEAFWDGDRWLSNEQKRVILATSGTANFPAFIMPTTDIWLENIQFGGFGSGNHDSSNCLNFNITQNIYIPYGITLETLVTITTAGLISSGRFLIDTAINRFIDCSSETKATTSFTNLRTNVGAPAIVLAPKLSLIYREVVT
jgi:hypothetical protein